MKKVLMVSTVASTIDQFNRSNLELLRKLGNEVEVFSNFSGENPTSEAKSLNFKEYLKNNKIKYKDIKFSRSIFKVQSLIKAYFQLKDYFSKNEINFIHVHTPIASVVTRIVASKFNIPVLYHAHGFHFYRGAPLINWIIYYPIERFLAKKTKAIIVINKEDEERAKKMGFKNIFPVPGVGIDLTQKKRKINNIAIKESLNLNDDIIITSVGELNKNKNHEVVIKALSKVHIKNFKYLICGIGPKEEYLRKLISDLNLSNNVYLLGYRTDIEEILNITDIFAFMSFREGLSVSLMEAMRSGVPIIASNIRGNNDLVDYQGGFLSDPEDVETLISNFNELLRNPSLREEFGKHNLEKIKGYSKDIVDKRMEKIYLWMNRDGDING